MLDLLRMPVKQYAAALTCTVLITILTLKIYISTQNSTVFGNQQRTLERNDNELMDYIRQRNNVSRLLNLRQQLVGQMACKVAYCYYMFYYSIIFIYLFIYLCSVFAIFSAQCA